MTNFFYFVSYYQYIEVEKKIMNRISKLIPNVVLTIFFLISFSDWGGVHFITGLQRKASTVKKAIEKENAAFLSP